MHSSEVAYGKMDITPLLTSKELYRLGGLVDFENEKYVVSVLYLGWAQPIKLSCYYGVSVHRGQITAAQPGSHLSPILGMAPFCVGRMWTDVQKHTARDKI